MNMRLLHETPENKARQKALAEQFVASRNTYNPTPPLQALMCAPLYPVDAAFMRNGRIVGLAEVKDRDFDFGGPRLRGGYPNFWLSAAKVTMAKLLAREMELPCKLIAGFTDGAYCCDIDQYERDEHEAPILIWDGRYDRGEKGDVEPLFSYPWSVFERLS